MNKVKYFFSFYKPHWKLFVFDLSCAFIVAGCNLFYPTIARNIINIYVPRKELDLIFIWSGILLAVYILKLILNYCLQYWGHIVGVRIQGDMRKTMFKKLEKLPYSYYDETKTGTIMSRIINDLMDISELAHHGPEDLFLSMVTFIGAFVIIAMMNIYLALIVFVLIPFILFFLIKRRKKQKEAFRQMRIKTGEINAQVESSISGIRVSKAYGATEHEIEKFNESNISFQQARGEAYRQMGIFNAGINFFSDMLYLIAILAGGVFFYYDLIDSGDFTAFILYITTLITPIRNFIAIFEQIQNGSTGFERFVEIMNEEEEQEDTDAIELKDIHDEIKYENVTFHYGKKDIDEVNYVIKDFSLTIKKGETVALVGPSGGGKTTLCHLLPRFYEIDSGRITIDGVDIRRFTRDSLRKHIGIVAQDVFLFSGTVKENIAYGNLDASDEEIKKAAQLANIDKFIESLPEGYNTYVGERGVKLSGGQKQRISIARAFLKNPEVLILDEATSALDNVTEMQIQDALDKLCVGRTTIVVAHRLSTVKKADRIIVITDKGIVEEGNHEELLKKNGLYASLYKYQFRD